MKADLKLNSIHHTSVICSDFERSKHFYTEVLGLRILQEIYRSDRDSYKLDLALHGHFVLELFTFPGAPPRLSRPEACGLRHLAFEVDNVRHAVEALLLKGVICEDLRVDEHTHKTFTFFSDPDGLPIELYEK